MPKSRIAERIKTPQDKLEELQKVISKNISIKMAELELNQVSLAILSRISQPYISAKLSGKKTYSLFDLIRLSQALHCDIIDLIK